MGMFRNKERFESTLLKFPRQLIHLYGVFCCEDKRANEHSILPR